MPPRQQHGRDNRPMGENHALAPSPQRTLDGWHRFVASGDERLLASLLSEHIVFRSPFVQSPIPGRPATLQVLTTVVRIFENFRYHRSFVAGSHDVALEFAANIGKWQLRGVDLIKFNEAGEMIEFEVMIRRSRLCRRWARKWGTGLARSWPGSRRPRPPKGRSRVDQGLIMAVFDSAADRPRACANGGLVARIGRLVEALLADSRIRGMLP